MIRAMCMALLLAACATTETPMTAAGHQPAEEAAILAVMDAYMHEISANDLAAMDARQTPEGMTYRIAAREDGGWDVVARPNSYWVAPERADDRAYRERYWSPTVMIRGAMALVWAPYEFQINGQTTHCGVDVFSFAKIDGVWRVSNSMWTVEPNACAELRPGDSSTIRPRDERSSAAARSTQPTESLSSPGGSSEAGPRDGAALLNHGFDTAEQGGDLDQLEPRDEP